MQESGGAEHLGRPETMPDQRGKGKPDSAAGVQAEPERDLCGAAVDGFSGAADGGEGVMLELNRIYCGDCLELMRDMDDKSVDLVLCDLPYGSTSCEWDIVIPLADLWNQYKRIIKENTPLVFTAREPFTSFLVTSNIKYYKHKWIWNKKQSGSFQNAKFMPLQIEEDILVFCKGKVNYNPVMRIGKTRVKGNCKTKNQLFKGLGSKHKTKNNTFFPTNILEFPNCSNKEERLHPTEKPVALFEYLIKTYSKEGDLVLDNCIGSGTTAVACKKLGRNFIGIEKEHAYVAIAEKRLEKVNNHKITDFFSVEA